MYHEWDTSDTSVTTVRKKCDTSATQTARLRHERYTNDTSATQVRKFDFDNDTSENIFWHPYISYMTNKRLQGVEKFHYKNYLLEIPRPHAKMHLKSAPQKLNYVWQKLYQKVTH